MTQHSDYLLNRFKPGTKVVITEGVNKGLIGEVKYITNFKSCPVEVKLPNAIATFPYDFRELDVA